MKLPKTLTRVTTFSKIIALMLFVLLPFGGFYVGLRYQQAVDFANQENAVVTPIQNEKVTTITLNDRDTTVYVHVGDVVILSLGATNKWQVHVDNPTVLQQYFMGIAQSTQTQGRYRVIAPGTAAISATGTANCSKGEMCPMYVIPFKVIITAS